jgi:hypothetical protein
MKRSTLVSAILGFYLGFMVTALFGSGITDLKWWLVVIPTILLSNWVCNEKLREHHNEN